MAPGEPSIVIVDDAAEVRLLLKTRLRLSGRLAVVGEGADGHDAVGLAAEHQPDLMLLDVSMPGLDGLEALPRVLKASPSTRVVFYSGFEEQGLVDQARLLGAAAFIEKSAPIEALVERLVDIATGEAPPQPETATVDEPAAGPVAFMDQDVLDEHLERFREVFEEAAIGMATMTLTGRLVRANRALASLLHMPSSHLVGVFYGDLTGGDGAQVAEALENIRRRPLDVVQLEHGVAHGGARRVRSTLAPVRDSGGRPLYLFLQVQDVTSERAAVEELRKSEERFRLLVEAVEDYAIFMLDPAGHIVSWNSGAQRSSGYSADEIIGQHFRIFYPEHVAARKHPEHELEIALQVGHYEEEGWRLRKDGSRFWANVLITAVFNEIGEHIGFAKVTRDNSERRRLEQDREQALHALGEANAELEALNARLQQSAQDQSQFLAVTAHELRTPIGVVAGSADTLSKHWDDLGDDDREELFEAMSGSTTRLRRLLADLLTASRLERSMLEMHLGPVVVADLVNEAMAGLRQSKPEAVVEADVPTDLTVYVDRDRTAQALDNLLSNALRHGSPPIRVTADRAGSNVEIRVNDSGSGVPEAMRARLFERYATGQGSGGTGLGLFIVREIARAQGGDATYEARSPGGMFVLRLPVPDRTAPSAQHES
ncbi:MAG TPA: PAS domain S-box protein [Nocardioidaceae bacterium]|nr:PAS domain S-box protein [Nocardioidaceae bacterium]